ncbi:MAG TPA: hypothetical protein VNH17_09690, partial [Streptosporangiaceae bacterium]|nr:hypothetical protein [Streptosporangiaceae bacterium]
FGGDAEIGDPLWLSPTNPGMVTNIRPDDFAVRIGTLKSATESSQQVTILLDIRPEVLAGEGISIPWPGDLWALNPRIKNTGVLSVSAGTGIDVDNTDPKHPTVANGGVLGVSAGGGIGVDNTDPKHPVVSALGAAIASVSAAGALYDSGTPSDPVIELRGGTRNFLCPYPDPNGTLVAPNTPLPDADVTLFIADDSINYDPTHATIFHNGVALTADRTYTLSPTGALTKEQLLLDILGGGYLNGFNLHVVNGGPGGGTIFTFPSTQQNRYLATFQFDGTDWALDHVWRLF